MVAPPRVAASHLIRSLVHWAIGRPAGRLVRPFTGCHCSTAVYLSLVWLIDLSRSIVYDTFCHGLVFFWTGRVRLDRVADSRIGVHCALVAAAEGKEKQNEAGPGFWIDFCEAPIDTKKAGKSGLRAWGVRTIDWRLNLCRHEYTLSATWTTDGSAARGVGPFRHDNTLSSTLEDKRQGR